MEYLSLTAHVKNEGLHIAEWLAYYKALGVEKFYLFDDTSSDNTKDVIDSMPFREDIELLQLKSPVEDWQGWVAHQFWKVYGKNTEWMIFCDVDEFFMPSDPLDLRDFLQPYKKHSALGVPWRIYGSSGHILRPEGLVLENYLHRAPHEWVTNNLIKSIVKPAEIINYLTCHMFETKNSTVDENGNVIDISKMGQVDGLKTDKIRVAHYFNKSYEDWIERRRVVRSGKKRPLITFDLYDQNEVYDDLSLKYVDLVKLEL